MMTIYKTTETGFGIESSISDGAWIHLIDPTVEEVNKIATTYSIEVEHLKASLDEEERARIETEDHYILILVDVPLFEIKEGNEIFTTIPLGIIMTDQLIITVCLKEIPLIQDFAKGKVKNFFTFMKTRFLLQILYKNASYFLQYLRHIDRKSSEIEKRLHKSMKNSELIQLLDLEKSLVYFTTSLKSNEIVLEKMLRMDRIKQYPDDQELLEDVIIENKQAMEMADIYSGILSGTMDAFASVISNNLNMVMKTLTSMTIVLSIPTMIASFYGMNVPLPLMNHPQAFLFIMLFSFGLSAILVYFMIKKKLF